MSSVPAPTWIRIEAPDAERAFALERRLAHLHPSVVGRGESWVVELEDLDDRLDEIEAGVRHWLRTAGGGSAVVHAGAAVRTVVVEAP